VIGVLKKPVPVSGTRNTGSKIRDFGILLYKCHFLEPVPVLIIKIIKMK
jgi:hypothetical protein